MKRYCQILELINDEELIRQYCDIHTKVWPEVIAGQREVGIVQMQIYRKGTYLFMICDTIDDFDWQRDMERLSKLPRQAEWEAYVSRFQVCKERATSSEKWQLMEQIFDSDKI